MAGKKTSELTELSSVKGNAFFEVVDPDETDVTKKNKRFSFDTLLAWVADKIDASTPATPVTATATQTPATTFGGSNGSITVTATGGKGAYEYSKDGTAWQASNVLTGYAAGAATYHFRDKAVTTNKGTGTITVRQAAPVLADAMTVVNSQNKAFDWTPNASFPSFSDYEYQLGSGAWASVTGKPQTLTNTARAIGEVKMRIKEGPTYDASNVVSNATAITAWVNATIALNALGTTSGTTGTPVTQNITGTVTPGNETVSAVKVYFGLGSNPSSWTEVTGVVLTGNTFTVPHTASATGSYKAEAITETGTRTTTTNRTITFTAAPIYAYSGFKNDSTTLTAAQIQAGSQILISPANADYAADYRANVAPAFLWVAEPDTQTPKTKWFGTDDNNGNIGSEDDLFGPPALVSGGWRFYITTYKTQNSETVIQFRKS